MNSIIHWKKPIFNNASSIYSADGKIGELTENQWKQTAEGELNNRKYSYRTRGFINQLTEIVDPASKDIVGKIEYNTWKSSATITYLDQSFHWKYDNPWQTRWSITDKLGVSTNFQGNQLKGSIEGPDLSEFLVLTGLFITNYYIQSTIVIMVAIFVPIITTLTN